MEVVRSHGCICLQGAAIEKAASTALCFLQMSELNSSSQVLRPHVTLAAKEELAAHIISWPALLREFQGLNLDGFFLVGVAVAAPDQGSAAYLRASPRFAATPRHKATTATAPAFHQPLEKGAGLATAVATLDPSQGGSGLLPVHRFDFFGTVAGMAGSLLAPP